MLSHTPASNTSQAVVLHEAEISMAMESVSFSKQPKPLITPTPKPQPTSVAVPIVKPLVSNKRCSDYRDLITHHATRNGIDPVVLERMLSKESSCNQYAISYTGCCYGMAQINLSAHKGVTIEQAYDPNFAIGWSSDYLRNLIDRTGNLYDALRSYNCGFYGAQKNKSCGAGYANSIAN